MITFLQPARFKLKNEKFFVVKTMKALPIFKPQFHEFSEKKAEMKPSKPSTFKGFKVHLLEASSRTTPLGLPLYGSQ